MNSDEQTRNLFGNQRIHVSMHASNSRVTWYFPNRSHVLTLVLNTVNKMHFYGNSCAFISV